MTADVEEGAVTDAPPRKKSRMRLILIIALPILLLLGGAAGAYFSGALDSLLGKKPVDDGTQKDASFFDLPDLLVNLNTGGRKSSFLKLTVSLQLEKKEDEGKVQSMQPRIVDTFQTYLRELRPEDMRGSAGLYRLREELLMRVNQTVAPVKIDDVLFREMLVQ